MLYPNNCNYCTRHATISPITSLSICCHFGKKLLPLRAFLLSPLLVVMVFSMCFSQDFGQPYYVKKPDFALDPIPNRDTRRIATYVPPGRLLYTDPKKLVTTVEGEEYTSYISQHGVRLLIPSSIVSSITFPTKYGAQPIIFHEDYYICEEDNIDCDESTGIPVTRGLVFQIVSEEPDVTRLMARNPKPDGDVDLIKGKLRTTHLSTLIAQGTITDARRRYPRYLVTNFKKFDSLSTECGEIKESLDAKTFKAEISAGVEVEPTGIATFLSKIFKLNLRLRGSAELEKAETIKASFGGERIATAYYRMSVDQFVEDGLTVRPDKHTFYIGATLACIGTGGSLTTPVFIQSLTIINSKEELIASVSIDNFYKRVNIRDEVTNDSPLVELYMLNQSRVYLTSINSPKEYERVIKIWQNRVRDKDISLAHIFLATFNVSCHKKKDSDGIKRRQKCYSIVQKVKD